VTGDRESLSTRELAAFFGRAWQLRFAAIVLGIVSTAIVTAGIAADSLQLSPHQRADAVLGTADALIQIPGSAPLGTDGRDFDRQLLAAVQRVGGRAPVVDYQASGLQTDAGDETAYIMDEFQSPSTVADRLRLTAGRWPAKVGEAIISVGERSRWPVGSIVQFFGGALRLRVVGVFTNLFQTDSREFVVAPGTWSSLRSVDRAKAARLDQFASRFVRWSGTDHSRAVLAAVKAVVRTNTSARQQSANGGDLFVESRPIIESRVPPANVPLTGAMFGGPLIAGLLGGILGGRFTTRIRTVMWTIGVPYAQTRFAATVSVLTASMIAAVVGTALGIGLGFASRPVLASIATQELGPVTSVAASPLNVLLGAVGAAIGLSMTRRRRSQRAASRRDASWDRTLFRIAGSAVLLAAGVFVGTGTSDVAALSLAALAVAAAIVIALTPVTVTFIRKLSPRSFAGRLALRKFAGEGRAAALTVGAIALLQVFGCTLAILVTSTIAQVNDNRESQVAPGQIVFQPELSTPKEITDARHQFERALGVSRPIVEYTAGAGSERDDGGTRVVATVDQLEQITRTRLSHSESALLQRGGTLVTSSLNGKHTLAFPPDGDFHGATFPAAALQGLDPSFRNIDGFMLERTAREAGLALLAPSYVYTDVTAHQQDSAIAAARQLNLNPAWVQVYRDPEDLTAPLRVSAITLLVSLVAALVLLLTSISEARSLRPDLASLRAIGVTGSFLATVVGVRMALTFVLATALGIATSAVGVAIAFSIAHLQIGVTIPPIPIVSMVASLAGLTAVAASLATRRLRNGEWQASATLR